MKIEEIQLSYYPKYIEEIKITDSQSAYNFALDNWNLDTISLYEEFKIILLNRNNTVLGLYSLSKGGVSGTVVDPKIVFAVALKVIASSIILVHNHPSGNLQPSTPDLRITEKLINAGNSLDIKILDHLILHNDKYYSFADDGRI